MKTCLYQPIFINPQAYFVFPSLYNIEKGDSFIEPANITGQLIINTLTDDPTLTPIILTVKDNNQVDFSIFAGKHIRISQYTDEGAVVLGEWLMPGESTPVYPDWFTSSVKAIYDPASQGMTNYDVIEAYVEDFTDWYKEINNGTVTATNKSFHFTEVKKIGSTNAIVRLVSHRINGEIKLNIKGVTEDNPISFTEYSAPVLTVNKDGVYTLVINDATVGIYFTKVGVVDVTVTQLPTSILKDFSGNGNHAYLYGGKGKLNSGMGVYQTDFTTWSKTNFDVHPEYIIATNGNNNLTLYGVKINSINVEIKGYNDKVKFLRLGYNNNDGIYKELNISNDGIYTIPGSSLGQEGRLCSISLSLKEDTKITITQIPDYPDQLCYDGKMYAVCYGFPILTDYTVMAERTWFEKEEYSAFISNSLGGMEDPHNGAFCVEIKSLNSFTTISFGSITSIGIPEKGITYQTKQSYNGNSINVGTKESNDILILGGRYYYKNNNNAGNLWNGCHGKIIIADRSFTKEEIDWIKENIYNIEI